MRRIAVPLALLCAACGPREVKPVIVEWAGPGFPPAACIVGPAPDCDVLVAGRRDTPWSRVHEQLRRSTAGKPDGSRVGILVCDGNAGEEAVLRICPIGEEPAIVLSPPGQAPLKEVARSFGRLRRIGVRRIGFAGIPAKEGAGRPGGSTRMERLRFRLLHESDAGAAIDRLVAIGKPSVTTLIEVLEEGGPRAAARAARARAVLPRDARRFAEPRLRRTIAGGRVPPLSRELARALLPERE